jgi:hypothetical protein
LPEPKNLQKFKEKMNMKSIKLAFGLTTFALAMASAASSYSVNFATPVWVGGTKLNAGQYKVEVAGDKATFKSGKNVVELPVTQEKSERKFTLTTTTVSDSKVKEIDLGGSTTKLVFASGTEGAASGK